jgi:hypothetical protein
VKFSGISPTKFLMVRVEIPLDILKNYCINIIAYE